MALYAETDNARVQLKTRTDPSRVYKPELKTIVHCRFIAMLIIYRDNFYQMDDDKKTQLFGKKPENYPYTFSDPCYSVDGIRAAYSNTKNGFSYSVEQATGVNLGTLNNGTTVRDIRSDYDDFEIRAKALISRSSTGSPSSATFNELIDILKLVNLFAGGNEMLVGDHLSKYIDIQRGYILKLLAILMMHPSFSHLSKSASVEDAVGNSINQLILGYSDTKQTYKLFIEFIEILLNTYMSKNFADRIQFTNTLGGLKSH